MISIPEILQTEAEAAAVIRLTVPRSEIRKVFGPAVGELMAALTEQGVKPSSPVFAHHLKMSADTFDFELGVKVAAPVKATGRGPYEGLPSAWGEFDAWMKANNHEKAESLWELYSVGPQSTPDPANWRTELNRPLNT